jgi:cytochrome c biogenesis protein ResB
MRVRVKLLILTVVLAVLGAFLVQGLVRAQPREHVVVIQSGALIPPENWS